MIALDEAPFGDEEDYWYAGLEFGVGKKKRGLAGEGWL